MQRLSSTPAGETLSIGVRLPPPLETVSLGIEVPRRDAISAHAPGIAGDTIAAIWKSASAAPRRTAAWRSAAAGSLARAQGACV